MLTHIWLACLCLCFVIAGDILGTNAQRNKLARRKQPKKPVGGKWVPLKRRTAVKRRKNAAKKNKRIGTGRSPSRGGSVKFDSLIQPPLLRSPSEAELQDPSWSHCLHNVKIDSSWSSISSPNFPRPIKGQLQCTWLFEGGLGTKLQISFNVLDLEGGTGGRCGNQFVDIIDLELQKSQGRFCGDRVPGDYVSVGRKLRLDIQADTSLTPHKGFQAAVRSVPYITQPGLRQRSTLFHGVPTLPPTTTTKRIARRPAFNTRRRITTTVTTTTTTRARLMFGQNRFGLNRQPARAEILTFSDGGRINTSIILYSFIGFFCLAVVVIGIALIFRKQLYSKYKTYKRKKKGKKEKKKTEKEEAKKKSGKKDDDDDEEGSSNGLENKAFSNSKLELPVSGPTTPSLDGRRRKSVIFEDEVDEDIERDSKQKNGNKDCDVENEARNGRGSDVVDSGEMFQGWNYPHGEPIYEEDALSVSSYSSGRSSSRHMESLTPRQQKIIEKNRELMEGEPVYAPFSEPIYHIGGPYGQLMPPNVPPPFYPGFMPSFQDPRGMNPAYPQMMLSSDSYSRGRPTPPFNGGRMHRTESGSPPPVYDDYHQGKFLTAPKSPDNSNNRRVLNDANEENLTPVRSTASFSAAETENDSGLYSTQSMSTLPRDQGDFPERKLERSQSFTG